MLNPKVIHNEDGHGRNVESFGDDRAARVRLVQYENQVSGHHRVMLFDDCTICKPVMEREYAFYKSVPLKLQRFVPKFKGIATAFTETDEAGVVQIFASKVSDGSSYENARISTAKECHRDKEWDFNGAAKRQCLDNCRWQYSPDKGEGKTEKSVFKSNPWVLKIQQMSFERNMYKSMDSKFILLENVGVNLQRPCILDLKMGTRQYGDDATDRKIKDHKDRCEHSTSKSLGLRLCGMQVYDPATCCYTYTDKYTGRALDSKGFENSLLAFVNHGTRTDVIEALTKLLRELRRSIELLETCRFFCSSLLLMYEGELNSSAEETVEVRMIDFSHATLYDKNSKYEGPDEGYIFGVQNLILMLENITNEDGESKM